MRRPTNRDGLNVVPTLLVVPTALIGGRHDSARVFSSFSSTPFVERREAASRWECLVGSDLDMAMLASGKAVSVADLPHDRRYQRRRNESRAPTRASSGARNDRGDGIIAAGNPIGVATEWEAVAVAMVRVAILSFWHVHAKDYARDADEHPDAEVAAAWDEDAERGRHEAAARGVRFIERLDDVLADPEIDGVVVTTATTAHGTVIPAAAAAGKHIYTEKVIAPTRREADEIAAAVREAGVAFAVSLPRLSAGYARAIKNAIDQGDLGTVTFARVRVAHDGALRTAANPDGWLPTRFHDPNQSAGGALIDLGAHPLYLLRWFLGLPERISATYGHVTGRAGEDNAVVTFAYPNGAIAVAEVGCAGRSPFTIEVHGTAGNALYGIPEPRLWLRPGAPYGAGGWQPHDDLPADAPGPFAQWIEQITTGARPTENVEIALDLSSLAEAANRSAAEGRAVRLAPDGSVG